LTFDELRVVDDLKLVRAERTRELEAQEQRSILGFVVRCHADEVVGARELLPALIGDYDTDAGRTRVAPSAAVDVDDDLVTFQREAAS
jgi:hypothetical protein